jgi:hypothetical protein
MNITAALRRELRKISGLVGKLEVRKDQIEKALEALTTGSRKKFKMSRQARLKISRSRKKYWANRKRNERNEKK